MAIGQYGVHEFATKYVNSNGSTKGIKVGTGQCGELVQQYFKHCLQEAYKSPDFPRYCNITGYVKDWATDSVILKYFNKYPFSKDILKDGDILIWTTKYVNYPHAAISRNLYDGKGRLLCLCQNIEGKFVTQSFHSVNQPGLYIFRLKQWDKKIWTKGEKVVLTKDIPAYPTATRAMANDRKTATYPKGTVMYVWKVWSNGAINLTKDSSLVSAGGWANPKDI